MMLVAVTAASAQVSEKPTLITEATYATVIAGRTNETGSYEGPARFNLSAALGVVKSVTPGFGVGGILTVGVWDDFYLAIGPRLRMRASPKVNVDVTPQVILTRGNAGAGKATIDIAAMYREQIGFAVQVGSFPRYTTVGEFPDYTLVIDNRPALFAGFKLGSKPGRYGILADAVALASTFALYLAICASNGCD